MRKRLQKKGTRSATRRLIVVSGRERRLKQDANHVVSSQIASAHPHALIGLENLTDIRERTRRRSRQRKKESQGYEPVSPNSDEPIQLIPSGLTANCTA